MSSRPSALLSATFFEPGYEHLVEVVHQRDAPAVRRLTALEISVWDARGKALTTFALDPRQEIVDLGRLLEPGVTAAEQVMVVLDARYDERVFPYRPHHYAYLHRRGSSNPPLYYAVTAVLGGVPDRIGATGINNFETYLFRHRRFAARYSVLLGNLSRFAPARARVLAYYDDDATTREVDLDPKAHVEVELPGEHDGQRLQRVELKSLFRLASYVVVRRAPTGEPVVFDHLFTYFR